MDSMNAIPMVADCMKHQPQAPTSIDHQWFEFASDSAAISGMYEREYPLWIGDLPRPLIMIKVWGPQGLIRGEEG